MIGYILLPKPYLTRMLLWRVTQFKVSGLGHIPHIEDCCLCPSWYWKCTQQVLYHDVGCNDSVCHCCTAQVGDRQVSARMIGHLQYLSQLLQLLY